MRSDGDVSATSSVEGIRKVIAKALNKNQKMILFAIRNEEKETLYSLLKRISRESTVSLSTLKLNARILRDLDLISYNDFVELTGAGKRIKSIMRCHE